MLMPSYPAGIRRKSIPPYARLRLYARRLFGDENWRRGRPGRAQKNGAPKEHPNYPLYEAWLGQTKRKLLTGGAREAPDDITKREGELHVDKDKLPAFMLQNIESVDYEAHLKK